MKHPNPPVIIDGGMTLRDYFAALAMLGMHNECYDITGDERAKFAYEQADEMLRARDAKR